MTAKHIHNIQFNQCEMQVRKRDLFHLSSCERFFNLKKFLAVLGLCCGIWAFSSVETGFSCFGEHATEHAGSVVW